MQRRDCTQESVAFAPAPTPRAWWLPGADSPSSDADSLSRRLLDLRSPLWALDEKGGCSFAVGGSAAFGGPRPRGSLAARAYAPACPPESLGDPAFRAAHGLRYACVSGAMANGIASVEVVEAMGRAGMLGFFGAAGLSPEKVEAAIERLRASLGAAPHGFNLIHSPNEPGLEAKIAELYSRKGVRTVEASAYLDLTLPVVRYRLRGIARGRDGTIVVPNAVVAKVSRVEVARKFLSPPPEKLLRALVASGDLDEERAALAAQVPMAEDVTAEADSGGHTDNRPLVALLPTLIALRDRIQAERRYPRPPRVGAAGGIATPASAAAAFAMGAAYVLTGSINQACVESGSSDRVRAMLAAAEQADTAMAPAADMFEMGVKVQVLKRGTLFPMRASKLYEAYRAHESLEALPADLRASLERDLFKAPLTEIWERTRAFFEARDPEQVRRAEADARHKMALTFRWYLGLSSRWANAGDPARQADYQVWCGPAMGAFNEWAKGSFLEDPSKRRVAVLAKNILVGAAALARAHMLELQGAPVPARARAARPMREEELDAALGGTPA